MPNNKGAIMLIISTIAFAALLCVSSICVLAYFGKQIPPELNTLTGGLVGAISTMLVKTSPTETTKTVSVSDQPVIVADPNQPKP